jgi:hypothetical protein
MAAAESSAFFINGWMKVLVSCERMRTAILYNSLLYGRQAHRKVASCLFGKVRPMNYFQLLKACMALQFKQTSKSQGPSKLKPDFVLQI